MAPNILVICGPTASGKTALAVELALLPPDSWACALPSLGLWLLVQSGTCLFFFSFAAFCAMFTGHVVMLPCLYLLKRA